MAIDTALRKRLDDLQSDYAHTIDDGELEAWPKFFIEDAGYKIMTREPHEAGLPMGVLKFEERLAIIESRRIDVLLVFPL